MRILENIAILVDADNAQAGIMDSIIEKVSLQGRIILKRIYGNWKSQQLKKLGRSDYEACFLPRAAI